MTHLYSETVPVGDHQVSISSEDFKAANTGVVSISLLNEFTSSLEWDVTPLDWLTAMIAEYKNLREYYPSSDEPADWQMIGEVERIANNIHLAIARVDLKQFYFIHQVGSLILQDKGVWGEDTVVLVMARDGVEALLFLIDITGPQSFIWYNDLHSSGKEKIFATYEVIK